MWIVECQLTEGCLEEFLLLKFFCCSSRQYYYSFYSRHLFRYYTVIHRIIQHQTYTFVIVIYQQIMKGGRQSCWADLSAISPQKGQSSANRFELQIVIVRVTVKELQKISTRNKARAKPEKLTKQTRKKNKKRSFLFREERATRPVRLEFKMRGSVAINSDQRGQPESPNSHLNTIATVYDEESRRAREWRGILDWKNLYSMTEKKKEKKKKKKCSFVGETRTLDRGVEGTQRTEERRWNKKEM